MPAMDFSDVLASPEFVDTFTVCSTTKTIGADGVEVVASTTTTAASGPVVPGKSSLIRLDDGSRVVAFIEVYTKFPLTDGWKIDDANSRAADIITWHGQRYTVMNVDDYSAFGAGFIHAACELLTLNQTGS